MAVIQPNTDPVYTTINANMLEDDSVDLRTIQKSLSANMVLTSMVAGQAPDWTKITNPMMARDSIDTENIIDRCILGRKIADHTIGREKFIDAAFVDEALLYDNSVTESKIVDGSVSTRKIADKAVTSDKLDDDMILRGYPTVEPSQNHNYEKRSIRNTILSPNAPRGGRPGDIWIRYS